MRTNRPLLTLIAIILLPTATTVIRAVHAQQTAPQEPKDPSPLYVVDFIDYAGSADVITKGTQAIQQYVLDTRRDPGIIRCDALAQLGRNNHLMIIEVWQNRAAFEKHEAADHTKMFRASIQSNLGAPFDQRLHFVVQ